MPFFKNRKQETLQKEKYKRNQKHSVALRKCSNDMDIKNQNKTQVPT